MDVGALADGRVATGPGRQNAAAIVLVAGALLVSPGSAGAEPLPVRAGGAWVGIVELSYTRYYPRTDAAERTDAKLRFTSRAGDKAFANAKLEKHNEYGPGCPTIHDEIGGYDGPASPPTASFSGDRYQVDYIQPFFEVTVTGTSGCEQQPPRRESRQALPVYIPITGRAPRGTDRVSGTLRVDNRYCKYPACQETELASWDLHRVEGNKDGGGEGGGRGGKGGRAAPGSDCERRTLAGTPLDDDLVGKGRPELVLALAGDDRARSRGGSDCLYGAEGSDQLLAGAGKDLVVGDSGPDRLGGGRGADRILSRDGEADTLRCGRGRDTVVVDRADELSGCEKVRRP